MISRSKELTTEAAELGAVVPGPGGVLGAGVHPVVSTVHQHVLARLSTLWSRLCHTKTPQSAHTTHPLTDCCHGHLTPPQPQEYNYCTREERFLTLNVPTPLPLMVP